MHLRYSDLGYDNPKLLIDRSKVNWMPVIWKETIDWHREGCAYLLKDLRSPLFSKFPSEI